MKEAKGSASKEHWEYVVSYVNEFSKVAYLNLLQSGLISIIQSQHLAKIDEGYSLFDKLYHRAYQELASYKFIIHEDGVNSYYLELRDYIKPPLKNLVLELEIGLDSELNKYLGIKSTNF
ncbi:MAG: hypothetical protein APF84_10505 [Gracilibacter sp. BRH_c7a]|nr:MAG: hypothetical protein APF84_10505 [Gracilibacter sp. BRH_c7a]